MQREIVAVCGTCCLMLGLLSAYFLNNFQALVSVLHIHMMLWYIFIFFTFFYLKMCITSLSAPAKILFMCFVSFSVCDSVRYCSETVPPGDHLNYIVFHPTVHLHSPTSYIRLTVDVFCVRQYKRLSRSDLLLWCILHLVPLLFLLFAVRWSTVVKTPGMLYIAKMQIIPGLKLKKKKLRNIRNM